ncbi:SMI1/KNR4 family protein [Pseudobacter ginsenosidimutans]|uniref:Uncharacterized protein n=1 Tax=Pseudobacter ginsenosidimutans TaxID=661488 RepID=A0A4V2F0B4_9BACT|nr:SMI1/KNR4 family protein [Pseudobacter ginsenosidimutans]QEC45666.1 SMI1/KNR4 family protein [Pseudobacter ginsenosidimutans]RZS69400.1 hypothetical protein EV199_5237 [Pseudobacter ginsenosidimutans]
MTDINKQFFEAFMLIDINRMLNVEECPAAMKGGKNERGWNEWKAIPGNLSVDLYYDLEKEFNVLLPESFINWHRSHFFMNAETQILRLPISHPDQPLKHLREIWEWVIPEKLIPQKLYPFGSEGNDTGPFVFDGRKPVAHNEFPVRVYDHEYFGDLKGLSPVIFSSFTKLLECQIHFTTELNKDRNDYEIIPEFFRIDPEGAGKTGKEYWNGWAGMMKVNADDLAAENDE